MATETLTAYKDNTTTNSFLLQQTSAAKTVWIYPGRAISAPYSISVERKLTNGNSPSNDHVILRISRIETNVSTGKPATFQASLDLSIPKDQSIHTPSEMKNVVAVLASLLNEGTAMEATSANRTKLLEGRDL